MHRLTNSTTNEYKIILRQNLIKNMPVTNEYVNLAESIYSEDISSMQGKVVKHKLKPLVDNSIEIPRDLV